MENVKQVIVVRADLEMRKGKIGAQVAHASMAALLQGLKIEKGIAQFEVTPEAEEWLQNSFTKVCVKVRSEQELLDVYNQAVGKNLPCSYIVDNGRTVFGGVPTPTCVGIGPASIADIDALTGELPLL